MKNKATCIFSSAKYPEENELKDYITAFDKMTVPFKIQNDTKVQDVVKSLDIKEIKEKRRYFHLPIKKGIIDFTSRQPLSFSKQNN